MARALEVSRAGYYRWREKRESHFEAQVRRSDLEARILVIHKESKGAYGAPRITAELHSQGDVVSYNTVASTMKSLGATRISPRLFKVTTTVSYPPDLVDDRHFDQGSLNAVLTSDTTSMRLVRALPISVQPEMSILEECLGLLLIIT